MRLLIKNQTVNLNPGELERAEVSFSFLHGRKFKVGGKPLSLNEVIQAVTKEALKPEQDKKELREWAKVFTELTDKGYKKSEAKGNFLVMLLAKIKHYFSKSERNKLLTNLNGSLGKPDEPKKEEGISSSDRIDSIKKTVSDGQPVGPTLVQADPSRYNQNTANAEDSTSLGSGTATDAALDSIDLKIFSAGQEEIEKALPSVERRDVALWLAAKITNTSLCRDLISKGAPLDFQDPLHEETTLIQAIKTYNVELVRILLLAGANRQKKNVLGENALTIAKKEGDHLTTHLKVMESIGQRDFLAPSQLKKIKEIISLLEVVEASKGKELSQTPDEFASTKSDVKPTKLGSNSDQNLFKPFDERLKDAEDAEEEFMRWVKNADFHEFNRAEYEQAATKFKASSRQNLPQVEMKLHYHGFRFGPGFYYGEITGLKKGLKEYVAISPLEGMILNKQKEIEPEGSWLPCSTPHKGRASVKITDNKTHYPPSGSMTTGQYLSSLVDDLGISQGGSKESEAYKILKALITNYAPMVKNEIGDIQYARLRKLIPEYPKNP